MTHRNHDPHSARRGVEPEITVSTTVLPHEDATRVAAAVRAVFPDWECEVERVDREFPIEDGPVRLSGRAASLDLVLEQAAKHRILDTALDAMTMDLEGDTTTFSLSRQAAFVGKVAFVVDERPFGGVMDVALTGVELGLWLEQRTWHEGRHSIPRTAGDDLSMDDDGTPTEWFDNKGRRTMGYEED